MKTGRGWWALVGVVLLTLLGLYVGAYYALIERRIVMKVPAKSRMATPTPFVRYRPILGLQLGWLFAPMHMVDKKLRPQVWNPGLPRPVPGRFEPPRIPESERF